MLLLLGQLTLIIGCALLLCIYVGWGVTRMALPLPLRSFAAPLVPLVGYFVTIVVGYLGVSTALNLRWSLAALLALATALNLLAWRRGGPPHLARPDPALALLLLATLLVGLLPLFNYGYLTAIGANWDTESYLPTVQHLLDYPVAGIAAAPLSPLRDLVSSPPRIGLTLGFSAFQGMTMLLSGQSALATFAPLLALLRALGALAIYVWLRATMGATRPAALLGAALAASGSLLLWVAFMNFGMQMAGWPLLALGLTMALATVEDLAQRRAAAWPALLLGAATLVALPVAYYPALTIWGPLALALGLSRLLEAWRAGPRQAGAPGGAGNLSQVGFLPDAPHPNPAPAPLRYKFFARRPSPQPDAHPGSGAFLPARKRGQRSRTPAPTKAPLENRGSGGAGAGPLALLGAAAALAGLTALLAVLPFIDYFAGFSFRYSLPSLHLGVERFIPLTDTLGLTTFYHRFAGPQPPALLVALAALCAGGAALVALLRGPQRLRWLTALAAVAGYLLWLRFDRAYAYGYLKGSAYAGFVFWALAAMGVQTLVAQVRPFLRRALPVALLALPLLTLVWVQALTVGQFWRGPGIFTRDIVAFEAAAAQAPPGATVAVSSDASFTGPISGQIVSFLYGREIWGHTVNAYSGHDYWPEGELPQYAALAAAEYPWPLALGGRELWRSAALAFFQLDTATRALWGRSGFYSAEPPASPRLPAELALWRRGGAQRTAEPGSPLTLAVGETLRFGPAPPGGAVRPASLRLTVATLAAQTLTLSYAGTTARLALEAGVSRIDLDLVGPATVTLDAEAQLALILAEARPRDPATPATEPRVAPAADQVAWSAAFEQQGAALRVRVATANPGRHALRAEVTLVENSFAAGPPIARLLAALPAAGEWQLDLDPVRGASEARVEGAPTPLLTADTRPDPADGVYFGVLTLYAGAEAVVREPLGTLLLIDGRIARLDPAPFTVEATPVGAPATPLPGTLRQLRAAPLTLDDGAAALEQALLERRPAWPGAPADAPFAPAAPLTVRLFWHSLAPPTQPLMVSVQALGPDDRKWAQWDGLLGGDWKPIQGWQPGERVRQDVPLRLDAATPPGSYRLLLIVYDPSSGAALRFNGQPALELGELLVAEVR